MAIGSGGGMRFSGELNLEHFFRGGARNSPFVQLHSATLANTNDDAQFALGGAAGYRWTSNDRFAARIYLRYRRWFELEDGETAVVIGVGALLGHRKADDK